VTFLGGDLTLRMSKMFQDDFLRGKNGVLKCIAKSEKGVGAHRFGFSPSFFVCFLKASLV